MPDPRDTSRHPSHGPPSFERFAAVRRFGDLAYGPDGRWLAYTADTTGRHELWLMPAGGGFARQLTHLRERRVTSFRWSPSGDRIAFAADRHGDEMHQLFVMDVDPESGRSGWPRQLTDDPAVQHLLAGWTPDGERLVASANDRDPTEVDPFLLDLDTGARERLLSGGIHGAVEVSPDGRRLLVVVVRGNTDQDLLLVDLETREITPCTPHEGQQTFRPGPWLRDGSGFYLMTNTDREFDALAIYRLASSTWERVHAPERDVERVVVSHDGRVALAVENDGGASRLAAWDLQRGRDLATSPLPLGVVDGVALHPNGARAALLLSRPREANVPVEIDIAVDDREPGAPRPLEQSMLGGLEPDGLLAPDLVHYPSFDRDIPAWLYRPAAEEPFPVVLSIHGGPEQQERPGYSGLYQYLLSRGIGVLAPNIRGSTGYGISYQRLIHRAWGGDDLRDIEHAALWLRDRDWVDPDRLAVFGGSYGGFATLSALARLPEYWACAVDMVGPGDLVTFVRSVPPHWRSMMADWLGDPEADREFLEERSPIRYVDAIRAPLLVIQGANDPRVVQAESDQMVERMRANGLEVEYWIDPEGGHGPADRAGQLRWMQMTAEYLERRLT